MSSFRLPFPSFRQVLEVGVKEPSRRNPFIPMHEGVIEGLHLPLPLPVPVPTGTGFSSLLSPTRSPQANAGASASASVVSCNAGGGGGGGGDGSKTQTGFELIAPPPTPPHVPCGINVPGPGQDADADADANTNTNPNPDLDSDIAPHSRSDSEAADPPALTVEEDEPRLIIALRKLIDAGFVIGRVVRGRSRLWLVCKDTAGASAGAGAPGGR